MISNNHVIARSDQAQTGEQIKTASRDPFAQLSCFIPLGDTTINVDVAVAKIHDSSVTSFKQVKGLGQITGIRKPNPNEHIRKSGARTGVTAGSIIGRANIRSGGRTFYGTWRESNGMACPGDSGSPVVSDGMQLIGIHTWGSGDCNAQRECYFFDLVDQKQLAALFSRNDEDK
jgi:S1-C subfamily serine protease